MHYRRHPGAGTPVPLGLPAPIEVPGLRLRLTQRLNAERKQDEALPDPCEGHPFPVLREYPTFKRIGWDWNGARNWLKHDKGPDARTIYQGEAALMIYRAIGKYSVTHKEIPNWWRQFLAWGAARDYFPAEIA